MRISDWSSDVCSSDLALDPQVLAVGPGCIDQHPLAVLHAVQLGAFVVLALLVAARRANRELRFLGLAQRNAAVLLRCAAERDTAPRHGVHAHDFGACTFGRPW